MKRVLVTGMSGTGKSAVIRALTALGYKAVDADQPGWSELASGQFEPGSAASSGDDWVWHEDRIQELLSTEDVDVLFLSGCASNQGKFYPQFDHIVLLSAPIPLMMERLATRTSNDYGKHPEELAKVLNDTRTFEPLLRRGATLEVDTTSPLDVVIETILGHVRP